VRQHRRRQTGGGRGRSRDRADRLPKGDAREVTVEVRNEHGERVLTVTVSMQVERADPAPEPPRA
jgi:hypothetical protein